MYFKLSSMLNLQPRHGFTRGLVDQNQVTSFPIAATLLRKTKDQNDIVLSFKYSVTSSIPCTYLNQNLGTKADI